MLREIDREIDTYTLELDGILQGSAFSSGLFKKLRRIVGKTEPRETTTTMDLTGKGVATGFSLVFDNEKIIFKRKGITQTSTVSGVYCGVSNNINPNVEHLCVELARSENISENIKDIIAHQKDLKLDFYLSPTPNQFQILMYMTDDSYSNRARFGVSHVKYEYVLTLDVKFDD